MDLDHHPLRCLTSERSSNPMALLHASRVRERASSRPGLSNSLSYFAPSLRVSRPCSLFRQPCGPSFAVPIAHPVHVDELANMVAKHPGGKPLSPPPSPPRPLVPRVRKVQRWFERGQGRGDLLYRMLAVVVARCGNVVTFCVRLAARRCPWKGRSVEQLSISLLARFGRSSDMLSIEMVGFIRVAVPQRVGEARPRLSLLIARTLNCKLACIVMLFQALRLNCLSESRLPPFREFAVRSEWRAVSIRQMLRLCIREKWTLSTTHFFGGHNVCVRVYVKESISA